jgi:hypothetical protein
MNRDEMIEALKRHEPVLRFTGLPPERFYPTAVEDYLKHCRLFHDGFPFDREVTNRWKQEANSDDQCLGEALQAFEGANYYLQLTTPKVGPGCLVTYLVALAGVVIFVLLLSGLTAAMWVLGIGVVLGLLAVYLIPAVMAGVAGAIRETPGFIMDFFSRATDEAADSAYEKVKGTEYVYYGRVTQRNEWTMLHYMYFYPFNDWRKAAEGINHHEGDWEAITIFLKGDDWEPYGVALSQHHGGVFHEWEAMHRTSDEDGFEHPVVYVALGSHANYPKPDVVKAPKLFKKGFVQTIIYGLDFFIRWCSGKGLFTEIADGKGLRIGFKALDKTLEIEVKQRDRLELKTDLLSTKMQSIVEGRKPEPNFAQQLTKGLTTTLPILVKAQKAAELEGTAHIAAPPRNDAPRKPEAKTGHLEQATWTPVVLEEKLPGWVNFQGLWGVKSFLKDESGPTGPMWGRWEIGAQFPRLRWQWPLQWLEVLEDEQKRIAQKQEQMAQKSVVDLIRSLIKTTIR